MSSIFQPAINIAGQSYYNNGALGAGTTTVVAAGSNVNGIVVRTLLVTNTTVNAIFQLLGASRVLKSAICSIASAPFDLIAGLPLMIPAGQQLDISFNAATGSVQMSYDLR